MVEFRKKVKTYEWNLCSFDPCSIGALQCVKLVKLSFVQDGRNHVAGRRRTARVCADITYQI